MIVKYDECVGCSNVFDDLGKHNNILKVVESLLNDELNFKAQYIVVCYKDSPYILRIDGKNTDGWKKRLKELYSEIPESLVKYPNDNIRLSIDGFEGEFIAHL